MKVKPCKILLLLSLSLTACTTVNSEFNQAQEINTIESYQAFADKYPYGPFINEARAKISELKKQEAKQIQLKNNWDKLSKGMSVDDVDSLIGPLNRGAVFNIKKMADQSKASPGTNDNQKTEQVFPYNDHHFKLIFDSNGRLSEWTLK